MNLSFTSYFLKVMINILCMCTVWGEPLSQTAQSFMPELIYGANRNLTKVPIDCSVKIYVNNDAIALFPLPALIVMRCLMNMCPCTLVFI
jgi:hypothetical protein